MVERLLTGDEMKLCDNYTIDNLGIPSRTLMERAADAVVNKIMSLGLDIKSTLVVCGSGNNGGDGFAVARFLAEKARVRGIEADIRTFFIGTSNSISKGCSLQRKLTKESGIPEDKNFDPIDKTLIIDAIFGIGLSREISGEYKIIIDKINASNAKILSIDIPSGISSDTGKVMGTAVMADITVTFASYKIGHFLYPGALHSKSVFKADIGIGTEVLSPENNVFTSLSSMPYKMPYRSPDSNKGTFGKVLVIGGAKNMAGAAYLSAKAAYRTGAGLVRIFTTEKNRTIMQTLLPEAVLTTYPEGCHTGELTSLLVPLVKEATAIIIGPGLSQSEEAEWQLRTVLESAKCQLILDADALNIIASKGNDLIEKLPSNAIITPHMGEMSRLTNKNIEFLKACPIESAKRFAKQNNIICAMKDAVSTISDGEKVYLNTSGCSALAKGGSGDVLTGIIGALCAEGMSPFEATANGSFIHGKAGTLAAKDMGEYSLLARDITDYISKAIIE